MEAYQNITFAQPEATKKKGISRRGFMAATLNAAVAAGIYKAIPRESVPDASQYAEEDAVVSPEVVTESVEKHEAFAARVAGYRALYTMENEVLFVDETGAPVGTIPVGVIDGISPGSSFDEAYGVVTDGYSKKWVKAARAQLSAQVGDVSADSLQLKTNWNALKYAVNDPDESMTYASVRSILDVVRYFGDKEVRGAEGESRIEYVRDTIQFTGNLAKVPGVADALRACVPGLCALESKFNDDVKSGVGARGIFQMKPETWEQELGRESFREGVSVPLTEQVKAAGELFSKMYDRVRYWCYEEASYGGRNYLEDIKSVFATQEEFEQFFLVPLIINAYNTGERGIGEVVRAFVETGTFAKQFGREKAAGFDVFQKMTEFGRDADLPELADYGPEASTYVQRVYAFAGLLS